MMSQIYGMLNKPPAHRKTPQARYFPAMIAAMVQTSPRDGRSGWRKIQNGRRAGAWKVSK
jgi:hypothetical protein